MTLGHLAMKFHIFSIVTCTFIYTKCCYQLHLCLTLGLPEDIKEASEKWKDILLTQFPSPKRILNESSEEEIVDLTTYIDGLLTAHVTVFVTGMNLWNIL